MLNLHRLKDIMSYRSSRGWILMLFIMPLVFSLGLMEALAPKEYAMLEDRGMGGPSAPAPSVPESPDRDMGTVPPPPTLSIPPGSRNAPLPTPTIIEKVGITSIMQFGMMFCALAAILSALVLLLALPIFLLSDNEKRVVRAGSLVKTTLGFFVGSGGILIGTISFA